MANHCANGTMTVNFGRATQRTDMMIRRLEECGISLDVVNLDDAAKVAGTVTKTVRKSIFKTMTCTGGGKKTLPFGPSADAESLVKGRPKGMSTGVSLKSYRIHPVLSSKDEWASCTAASVRVFRNKSVKSMR